MKTLFAVMIIGCAVAAYGQTAGSLSSQVTVIQIPDHPQHASLGSMASEQSLVGGAANAYVYAQGERPLWEFGPVSQPVPLGDVARAHRKERLTTKKAELVFEKQGS